MAMIKCKECGKEISDKAERCPSCGCPVQNNMNQIQIKQNSKEGKASGLSITALIFSISGCAFIVGVILAIIDLCKKDGRKKTCSIIALVICGMWFIIGVANIGGLEKSDNSTQQSNSLNVENDNNLESIKGSETKTTSKKEKTEFYVGETAEYKNVQVTLIGYEESNGNDWGNPESGKIFVFPEIEVCNNSDKEISISSIISFECYVDDYKTDFSSNAFMTISTENGKQQLDGSIAPGKKLKGVLGIEAPTDWKTIEIYYKDNVWLNSNFSFKIEK